jgi:hypothetical protein
LDSGCIELISKNDLNIIGEYEFFGEKRFRICVKGTNIIVNVKAVNEQEALTKALQILSQVGLTNESLNELRNLISEKAVCK